MANTENVPIDKLFSKDETINYCRIILLMVDVGTETLLHLFYSHVPKDTVKHYFASKISEIERERKKVFDKSQYAKLTCSEPNPDEFDISLLIKLLTYFKLSPLKLDCLQSIRNEIIGHKSRGELTKHDFECLWVQVENILLNIARCVSGDEEKETKLKVEELKQKVLDVSDREKKIIKAFETWCQEKITLLQENMDNLRVDVTENRESIESLKEQVNEIKNKTPKPITCLHDLVSESQHPANGQYTLNDKRVCGTDDKIVSMLQQDLIAYYRRCFSRLAISPLIDEDDCAVDFLEIYVKPILSIPSHQSPKGQSQSIPVKSCHDIFVWDSKPCQNIYISSPAGCGKTTFARWLALTWCQSHQPIVENNKWFIAEDVDEMRTFFCVFLVFLRDSHECECDVDTMIQNQLLLNLANSATYAELGVKFFQNLLNSAKCIIILDGLDEWSHPSGNMCTLKNKHIPHSKARPLSTTLTTSRPWKLDVVALKPGEIDQKLELNGLEGDLLKCLIGNVVTKMNKKMNKVHGKEMKADDFELELRCKKLTALSKIPVVLMQLLTVWFDNEQLGESQCKIYSNMIEFLLKRYCKKREIVSVIENMVVHDFTRDRQTPMLLQNQMYCKVHMQLLSTLATLAYNTLFTDKEESSLVFDRRIAKIYLTDTEIEMSLAVGILTQEKVISKMSIRQSHISFIHKTFQEYLAALYVALSPQMMTDVEEKIKSVCCSIEKILEMSQIFMFLNGLCPEVTVNLHEHLRQTVSKDSRTQRYRASYDMHPELSSVGRTLLQVQETMLELLAECWLNEQTHVIPLPVSDFFIGGQGSSLWSDKLKSLTVHNPVCSLYIAGVYYSLEEIEDILNSVTVFNSIQKLWFGWVSKTFVVQLVSRLQRSLSVRPETWRNLQCVTLVQVENIPGDIFCSLIDSILQLPKSVWVCLLNCSISRQTMNWKAYIVRHHWLKVKYVDVDDNRRVNVKILHFHTNKV